jgi:hypothetical protein
MGGSFFVIAFASYVEEEVGSGFAQSFSDWLKARTEITKCAPRLAPGACG